MKNSQKGFIIPLVVVIVALVIGGGAYVYIKNKQVSQTSIAENTQDTNLAPTVATNTLVQTDETAGWKTYQNNAFGFKLKVPVNNEVYICDFSHEMFNMIFKPATEKSYLVFIFESSSDISLIKSCGSYNWLNKNQHLSIAAKGSGNGEYSFVAEEWKKFDDKKYSTVEETKFSGHDALVKTKKAGILDDPSPYKRILIDGGAHLYSIDLLEKSDLLEKIISTIEFIPSYDEKISNWNIFKSDDFGFEVKYPYSYESATSTGPEVPFILGIWPIPQKKESHLDIIVKVINKEISLNEYVSNFIGQDKTISDKKYIDFSETQGVKIRWFYKENGGGTDFSYISYFAILNGYAYEVEYRKTDKETDDNFEKTISTIKLTSLAKKQ